MLTKSEIIFNKELHTYHLGELQLKGITGVLSRYLFSKKYDNIPVYILEQARVRGEQVHKQCENYNIFPVIYDDSTIEIKNYVKLLAENNITPLEAEFLVSNQKTHATQIDMIDTGYNLYDIKTTSVIDTDYLSWQLSICAYLFELQTGEKAGKLYGIWLKNEKSKLIEVERIDAKIVKSLLDADAKNKEWVNPIVKKEIDMPEAEELTMLEAEIDNLDYQLKELKAKKEIIAEKVTQRMIDGDKKTWANDSIKITRVEPTTSPLFNSKLFKEEHPELYEKYVINNAKKGYLKITFHLL